MYKSNRLFDEFVDIERNINTGRVDHSPSGHKDVLDAVCGATFTASKHAEEYAYDYGETLDHTININNDHTLAPNMNQIAVDFEQELLNLLDPVGKQQTNNPTETTPFGAQPVSIIGDGIILW